MLKAIDTVYAGHKFRSRTEARWAVAFDQLGVQWRYEEQGYDLDGVRYLPDFWLPDLNVWIEVKAEEPDEEAWDKAAKLSRASGKACYLAWHLHANTPRLSSAFWNIAREIDASRFWVCDNCGALSIVNRNCLVASFHFFSRDDYESCRMVMQRGGTWGCQCYFDFDSDNRPGAISDPARLNEAFLAARQARFEFGEKGGR